MKVDRILYSKTYQIGLSYWEKIGVEAQISSGENVENALAIAKKMVEDFHTKANPEIMMGTTIKQIQPDNKEAEAEINKQFELTKKKVSAAKTKEEAEAIMIAAKFHLNVELKNIANSKPSKNEKGK